MDFWRTGFPVPESVERSIRLIVAPWRVSCGGSSYCSDVEERRAGESEPSGDRFAERLPSEVDGGIAVSIG